MTGPTNPPRKYTARELIDRLKQYGDLPVALVFVDQDGAETTVMDVRVELNITDVGRYVTVVGYADDEDTDEEVGYLRRQEAERIAREGAQR